MLVSLPQKQTQVAANFSSRLKYILDYLLRVRSYDAISDSNRARVSTDAAQTLNSATQRSCNLMALQALKYFHHITVHYLGHMLELHRE